MNWRITMLNWIYKPASDLNYFFIDTCVDRSLIETVRGKLLRRKIHEIHWNNHSDLAKWSSGLYLYSLNKGARISRVYFYRSSRQHSTLANSSKISYSSRAVDGSRETRVTAPSGARCPLPSGFTVNSQTHIANRPRRSRDAPFQHPAQGP